MTARRLGAALVVGLLPWTVLVVGPDVEFVFAWGLVTTSPIHAVSLSDYLFRFTRGVPDRLLAWPAGAVLYAAGVAAIAVGAATGREDRRLVAGLFALAGATQLAFALGIARRNPDLVVALPLGTVALWGLAWRSYRRR